MDYWHLQMHLPSGRDQDVEIDSNQMLQETKAVIGIGEWDDLQCKNFKGENDGLKDGSIVMVRRGNEPLALVKVVDGYFNNAELESKYLHRNFRYVKVLAWNAEGKTSSLFSQGTLKRLYERTDTASWNYINDWYKKAINMAELKKIVDLLKFKKQVILQGPPGTGKTRLAKRIVKELLAIKIVTEVDIKDLLFVGLTVNSSTNYTKYTIKAIGDINVTVGLKTVQMSINLVIKKLLQHMRLRCGKVSKKRATTLTPPQLQNIFMNIYLQPNSK